ncbi:MAG: hypothetical protein HYU03_01010, partial [Thaumarchaeota archaeon]|nr:hypothetical protein [Nitrososphaerota archaeon]
LACVVSLITSVWMTLLVTSFVGNPLLVALTFLNAMIVTGVTTVLLVRPRKVSVPATLQAKVPEEPPQQLA